MTGGGESWFRTCAACGARLTAGESHPVSVGAPRGREVPLYSFCDDDCLAEWREAPGTERGGPAERDGRGSPEA